MKNKKLKTPDFTRPTMWATEIPYTLEITKTRLRIIYPDGRTEWFCEHDGVKVGVPCWALGDFTTPLEVKSPARLVKLMKAYDKRFNRKTYFMGNI